MRVPRPSLVAVLLLVGTAGPVAAQVALTPQQQVELNRQRDAEQKQTEAERRSMEQQYQEQLLQESAVQNQAFQAQMGEAAAKGEFAGTTTVLALQEGMDTFNDKALLIQHNTAKQVEMIAKAADKFLKSRRGTGNATFGGLRLANPFASKDGSGVDLKKLPGCLTVEPDSGTVAVGIGCAASLCNGRLQDGDVLLREDGTPVDSADGAETFLLACAEPGPAPLVFRPSAGDVVAVP